MEVVGHESVDNQRKKSKKKNELQNEAEDMNGTTRCDTRSDSSGIEVSMFDYSAENHFRAMDNMCKICGEADSSSFDEGEIERLASSIIFLSEWRYFHHKPRSIRFVSETGLPNSKEAHNEINLSQFSAASVPKCGIETENVSGALLTTDLRKDFVLYVGGLVWALDWCPRLDQETNSDTKCEFIAVASHPPDSSYHKLGARLSGRGMIQIWCLFSSISAAGDMQAPLGNTQQKSHKNTVANEENKPKRPRGRPRGRPRKNPIDKTPAVTDPEGQLTQALVVQVTENSSDVPPVDENILNTPVSGNIPKQISQKNAVSEAENKPKKPRGRPRKNPIDKTPAVTDSEAQLTQALVVQVPENSSDVPPVDENILNTPVSRNIPKQISQKNAVSEAESKPKKHRRRPRKNVIDKTPAVTDPEGQLTQALVQVPEYTSDVPPVDENILNTPVSRNIPGPASKTKQISLKNAVSEAESKPKKPRERPRKNVVDENTQNNPALHNEKGKKQKAATNGKNTVDKTADVFGSEEPFFQALAVEFPENMPHISSTGENLLNDPRPQEEKGKKRKVPTKTAPTTDSECTISDLWRRSRKRSKAKGDQGHVNIRLPTQNEGEEASLASQQEGFSRKDDILSEGIVADDSRFDLDSGGCHFPKDALPRVALCLGHDGKVAWDVKWRPVNACESINKHRIGYLAVVLGNGSIEVWEIPSPQIIKCIYASRQGEATDPRFAKLKPVFRCSTLKYGDRQSMPLTMEWSAHSPHDLILAGCHDGVVGLWKFSTDCSSEDSFADARPMLCFSAETVPIRALSWAPFEGDTESTNVIVTAGHGGLKFWDLRDPFRPLWDANPSQHFVYGLDWLPDPRCVIVSYDDGTLRILSLTRAAYDAPVTGEPFNGTLQQGLHSYFCSSSAIWSIHVSRRTGMVAYCSAGGTVLYFQLTHKAVDKDPCRNRAPHFLCGALVEEESVVTVNTHLPSSPHLMKKSATEWANTPRSARTVVSGMNQANRVRKETEKNKTNDQVLALCYGDGLGNGGSNDPQKSSKSGIGKSSDREEANNDQALVCKDADRVNTKGKCSVNVKEDASGEIEVLPSKLVSMYRVRWNMNKGSDRWLCYGGGAGIVRCQEIIAPVVDKKLLKRCTTQK